MNCDTQKTSAIAGKPVLVCSGGSRLFGKEKVVLKILAALMRSGARIECLTSAWADGQLQKELQKLALPTTPVYLGWLYLRKPYWSLATLLKAPNALLICRRAYQKLQPKLTIHDSPRTVLQLLLIRRGNNILLLQDYYRGRKDRTLLWIASLFCKKLIACSHDVKSEAGRAWVSESKIEVIHNSVAFYPEPYKENAARQTTKAALVGQIIPRKGHHIAFAALEILKRENKIGDFIVKVVGTGDRGYLDFLQDFAQRKGLRDHVQFAGYVECQSKIYEDVSFCLVPSLEEPFGLTAIEPAVYGLPTIASRCGGLAEVIQENVTGLLAEPNCPESLAAKIEVFVKNPRYASQMGAAARRIYSDKFGSEKFESKYLAIIEDCL
jgi:glycosyltransferase involved in cell wall biosynthesis